MRLAPRGLSARLVRLVLRGRLGLRVQRLRSLGLLDRRVRLVRRVRRVRLV